MPSFFPNSNSFGVFSHSKGFGAEWLFASLWFSGADPSWASKRFRRRFHAKVPPTPKFSSFQSLYGSLGQIRREIPSNKLTNMVTDAVSSCFLMFCSLCVLLARIRLELTTASVEDSG